MRSSFSFFLVGVVLTNFKFVQLLPFVNEEEEIQNFKIYPTKRVEDFSFWMHQGKTDLNTALERLKSILGKSSEKGYDSLASIKRPKNLVVFIGDGLGISTITAARIFKGQSRNGVSGEEELLLWEEFPEVALLKTYNVDHQTPDSAGTASALFSGVKTNYKTMGYDSSVIYKSPASKRNAKEVTTLLQWAQESGMRTGFVTNTRLTHATPGALYAHSASRDWECDAFMTNKKGYVLPTEDDPDPNEFLDIARQLVERKPGNMTNVILGGGGLCFRSNDMNGQNSDEKWTCERKDGRDLIDEWKTEKDFLAPNKNFVVHNKQQLSRINANNTEYLFGVFSPYHLTYEDERDDNDPIGEPSLQEMSIKATEILKRNADGFFLMVEGGRIDQGHHDGLANRAISETLAFEDALRGVMDSLQETNQLDETLIIVTADHSHVMTISGYPKRGTDIRGITGTFAPDQLPEPILSYANGPGYFKPSDSNGCARNDLGQVDMFSFNHVSPAGYPARKETHGGEDVGLWARGPMSFLFHKSHEQSYVAHASSLALCIGPHKDHDFCKLSKSQNIPTTATTSGQDGKMKSLQKILVLLITFLTMLGPVTDYI